MPLFNKLALIECDPVCRVSFTLFSSLSFVGVNRAVLQDHVGIYYHVFHKPCLFGVEESLYNLLSKLGLLREKGDAINYTRSTGINQTCPRPMGIYGLSSCG